MNSVSILEWNINQRGGRCRGGIPHWVKDEIKGSDIAVLTEFRTKCEGRTAFIEDLERAGYCCAASENPGGNDILIAVKSHLRIVDHSWVPCRGADSIPENLRVDIDCGEGILTVIGLRIKDLGDMPLERKYKTRQREFLWGLNRIKDLRKNPILMTGDFNSSRRGSPNADWSMSVMDGMLKKEGFARYTPEGSSMFEEKSINEFPYDHFIARGAEISLEPYDRGFTGRDPAVYRWQRDFRVPHSGPGQRRESVAPPFPDHAILKGTLRLPEQKKGFC